MNSSNDFQIGGNHYNRVYQHWDMVLDTEMHYLLGCATKYSRWRDKNGIEDLKKCAHYISKASEEGVFLIKRNFLGRIWSSSKNDYKMHCVKKFAQQFQDKEDRELILLIAEGRYAEAQSLIGKMITETEAGPGPHYIKG